MNFKKSIKETLKKSGKYLREISVVVIGVAITLSASYWLGVKKEKRDMALHLRAIKMELQENAGDLFSSFKNLKRQCRYTAYLQSHDKESLDKDTLNSYVSLCYAPPGNFTFRTNAFEMFKNSGTMRLMDDKELLRGIWNVYDNFAYLKELINEHNRLKLNFIEKEISLFDVDRGKIEFNSIPMYDFYKKTNVSNRLLELSEIIFNNVYELYLKLLIEELITSKLKTYPVTDEELDKYIGVYSCDLITDKLIVTRENKQLFVQLTGQMPLPFFATAKNKFVHESYILEFNPIDKTIMGKRDGMTFNFVREE